MKNITYQLSKATLLFSLLISFIGISQTTIDSENFESGLGIWNDPGSDMKRENNKPPNSNWA